MDKESLFVAYFFDESDGVGALRSLSLYNFLLKENINIKCISKNTFKKNEKFLVWLFKLLFHIIKTKPKSIYVSCGPFHHLYPLAIVSKLLRIKLLVDFRDPWSLNIKRAYGKKKKLMNVIKYSVSVLIEKQVYNICRYFIVCTTGMSEEYTKLFKDCSKIKLITNGHTLDVNREELKENKFNNKINYVCIGKFAEYSLEKAIKTLQSIQMFCSTNKVDYEIHFIGSEKKVNQNAIELSGLSNSKMKFYGRRSYIEAIELAKKFDIGICIIRDEKLDFGTKVFDYIGLGLPVIGEFDKTENFYNYFREIIVCNDIPKVTLEDKIKYKRETIFKDFLYLFEME
ncbi:hypothetical protein [Caldalkalibacillus salinus]|uniref:hypothetical protein n=1 Tax=Caldalkalibacillus salinus TaxID=2803787 RepID=UPI00192234AF|nr:hypothetical protein [Caldalkalibacillus salinus]